MGVLPEELPNGHLGETNMRGPPGEQPEGDKRASSSGIEEAVKVENAVESDDLGRERVQLGVSGPSLETSLGCVGGLFLPAGLDGGGDGGGGGEEGGGEWEMVRFGFGGD